MTTTAIGTTTINPQPQRNPLPGAGCCVESEMLMKPEQIERMVGMARECQEREWKVREISDDDDTVLWLVDKEYANLGDIVFPDDAEFVGNAPYAILALHQQVQELQAANAALQARVDALEAQSEHLKLLFDCVIGKAPLPPIKGYSVAWHYSEDCYLYDSDLAEMQGHICYSWEGEDDAPQVASYESIAFFVVYGDDDDETLAESVKAWKVKGGT